MGEHYHVDSEYKLECFIKKATELYHKYKWTKYTWAVEKRSIEINSLSHVWYREVSNQLGEDTIDEVRSFCKLTFGVPILRQKEKFNNFYTTFFAHLSYQKQLAAMKYLSITSTMDRVEMKQYMNQMLIHYSRRGVILSSKNQFQKEVAA